MQLVAAETVRLVKSGRNWQAVCPFWRCRGKTEEALFIYADGFHCFGCGAHGNEDDFQRMAAATKT